MNKDIFFLGIQGCGKGTQAKILFKKLSDHYEYLEMGQLFRAIMSNDNIIGNFCKDIVNRGELVPHFVSLDRFHTALEIAQNKGCGLMVDGFPRAMEQAEAMVKSMKDQQRDYVVVHFVLSKEQAIERMKKRAQIEGRADDTLEAMNTRIETFMQETMPVIEYLESLDKVIHIDASGTIDEVEKAMEQKLAI